MDNDSTYTQVQTAAQQATIDDAKRNLPGEQMARYSDNRHADVSQMTCTLNGPAEEGQKQRG